MKRKSNVKTWKKIGGGTFTMADGTTIQPGETFKAAESQVPEAFRDVIILIDAPEVEEETQDEDTQQEQAEIEVAYNPEEQDEEETQHVVGNAKRNVQARKRPNTNWWDVFVDGKQLNSKALNKKDAQKLEKDLQED